jgi:hypothetical protein
MKYTKVLKVLVSCTDLPFFTRTITDLFGMSGTGIPFHTLHPIYQVHSTSYSLFHSLSLERHHMYLTSGFAS